MHAAFYSAECFSDLRNDGHSRKGAAPHKDANGHLIFNFYPTNDE